MENNKQLQNIDWDSLGFAIYPTRSMYIATCDDGGEWQTGKLKPYGDISISPAAGVLNYGQGVFEGVKAFRSSKDRIVFFRLKKNAERFATSSERVCIPPVPVDMFIEAVKQVVADNEDYIPPKGQGALYIRPVAWGTGPVLGVKPAPSYTFLIYVSPVGPYFRGGIKPLNLKITDDYHRAAPKGIGNVKAIGNYSAALYPRKLAVAEGYDEVIYLNAANENLIEEVGAANIFAIKGNVLQTPRLAGSILPGITRNSVLHVAKNVYGLETEETDLTVDFMLNADEVFASGTAVVVNPIGKITYKEETRKINNMVPGEFTMKIRETIMGIQNEEITDPFGWINPLK
jgi:branched-chain amino acid aminotransferase